MNGTPPDKLYQLLPAVWRMRDPEPDHPLRALLGAIEAQADSLAAQIARLYDNWFIETCEPDLIPYFADLLGLQLGAVPSPAANSERAALEAVWRRRQVANAIADRRRKGTLSILEQLAGDASGWPARAVELDRLLMRTPSIRLTPAGHRRLPDLSDADSLELLSTPFTQGAPLCDVRRISSRRTPGTATPGAVALWLWRLVAEDVQRAPAAAVDEDLHYTFDQLGRDTALAIVPSARARDAPPAIDLNVAMPISRSALAHRLEDYYGASRSLCVYRGREAVPRAEILVADLSGWRVHTPPGRVCIDPELGRIAFPERHPPKADVFVSYARLGMGAIGGGHYPRPQPPVTSAALFRVGTRDVGAHRSVGAAVKAWRSSESGRPSAAAVIEIVDDGSYAERFDIELHGGERLTIRAAPGCRPILAPEDARGERSFRVTGSTDDVPPSLVLEGVWIAGHPLELTGRFTRVQLSHCTLVPRGGPGSGERRATRHHPSLVVRAMACPITVASSVVGQIRVDSPEVGFDPISLTVCDSVIDACDPHAEAIYGADGRRAWVSLRLERVTVFGGSKIHRAELIADSLLTGPLHCERRQTGEVRFSYVHRDSTTPRRIACQPDGALAAVGAATAAHDRSHADAWALARVAPRFDATTFGAPAYARLARGTPEELAAGASDEGEMGAYHDLWQSLRITDLRARLAEFTPAGIDIDIRFAS